MKNIIDIKKEIKDIISEEKYIKIENLLNELYNLGTLNIINELEEVLKNKYNITESDSKFWLKEDNSEIGITTKID